jgi:hypothetical protein
VKYIVIGALWGLGTYFLTGYVFERGYEQGYVDGRDRALMEQGTTAEQCFRWWFGENKKQFEHEMKQFCKRSDV